VRPLAVLVPPGLLKFYQQCGASREAVVAGAPVGERNTAHCSLLIAAAVSGDPLMQTPAFSPLGAEGGR